MKSEKGWLEYTEGIIRILEKFRIPAKGKRDFRELIRRAKKIVKWITKKFPKNFFTDKEKER
jgi:hypothetical protein